MKKLFKYSQQIITGLVLLAAAGGVAFAGPSFNITTLISGFIRASGQHNQCVHFPCSSGEFKYGYGWSGLNQEWGYGYGYISRDFNNEIAATRATEFGFEGNDGAASIDGVDVTQTTATVTYSTNYLARFSYAYAASYPVTEYNVIGAYDNNTDYVSGDQVANITDLSCDTTYYFMITAKDSGNNHWTQETSFTTSPCATPKPSSHGTQVSGSTTNNPLTSSESQSQKLRLPPITLALGSVGIDVQDLQILLNHIGVFLDSHGAGSEGNETQFFGKKTFAAVKAFQQVFGLKKVDGIYGIETQTAMGKMLN